MTQRTSDDTGAYELMNEVFSKCFLVLFAHIQRKLAIDSSYEEPRFLRAMLVLSDKLQDATDDTGLAEGEIVSGVSVSEDTNEGYMVLLKKRTDGFEFFKVIDIVRNREIDIPEVFRLIQLSILLDNIDEEDITWAQAMSIFNSVIPEVKFVRFPSNQWKKYRDKIYNDIELGVGFSFIAATPEFNLLRDAKSYGEVPQRIRGLMAGMYVQTKYPDGKAMGLSSPENTVPKYKIMDMCSDILYGKSGDHLRKKGVDATPGDR